MTVSLLTMVQGVSKNPHTLEPTLGNPGIWALRIEKQQNPDLIQQKIKTICFEQKN